MNLYAVAVFLVLLGMFAAMAHAEPAPRRVKVLMFGDSLTSYGLAPATEKALVAGGGGKVQWTAVNGGKGGEAAEEAKSRILPLLEKEKPQIITIEYAANDLAKGYKPKQYAEHMEALIKMIEATPEAPKIVLMTITPVDTTRHSFGKDQKLIDKGGADFVIETEYNAVLRDLANRKGLGLVDIHRQCMTAKDPLGLLSKDGIHLTPEGYSFVGGYVGETLLAYFNAEIAKTPDAVALRTKAVAEVAAIRKAIAPGGDAKKLLERLEKVWRECPYLAQQTALWHALTYPPGVKPPPAKSPQPTKPAK